MKDSWILENCIHELLRKDELVVIPHFGAFVSDFESAQLNNIAILPPSRKIIFNKNLTKDDGVLAKYVSEVLEMEYIKSKLVIAEAVYGWKKQLAYGESVSFNQVGELCLNEQGHLSFQAIENKELQGQFFGLERVKAQKLDTQVKPELQVQPEVKEEIEVKTQAPSETKVVELPRKREDKSTTKRKWSVGRVAAVATPLLLAGLAWYGSSMFENNKNTQTASMVDISATELTETNNSDYRSDLEKQEVIQPEDFFTLDELQAIRESKHSSSQEASKHVAETVNVKTAAESEYRYHVIAGCFSEEINAQAFAMELEQKGFEARIVGKTSSGLHRVAYGSHTSKKEALLQLAKVKLNHNRGSWILSE